MTQTTPKRSYAFQDVTEGMSRDVCNAAASICDDMREGRATYKDLEKALRKLEPNIPEEKISRLYGYGMWVTR